MGCSPVAFSCVRPHPCLFLIQTCSFEVCKTRPCFLPSFPDYHAYPISKPFVQCPKQALCIRPFEIIRPASNHLVESVLSFLNPHSIASSCYFADFVLEFLDAHGMNSKSPFSPVNVEAVPQVFDIVDVCHFCFLPIHF